jgi:hypothetical protein
MMATRDGKIFEMIFSKWMTMPMLLSCHTWLAWFSHPTLNIFLACDD